MKFSGTVLENAMRLQADGCAFIRPDATVIKVASGPNVYTVVVDGDDIDCTCPATTPCKHMAAALLELRDV